MENFDLSPKPKKKTKHKRLPVYQFDIQGNLIYRHETTEMACENLCIPLHTLRSVIRRENCYLGQFYLSRSKDFKIPLKKGVHNPLFSRNKAFVPLDASYEEEED